MVRIRLMRVGKRKQPSYRVVVADSRSPRDGRIIEAIGHYQPRQDPSVIEIDSDRAVFWLERGAQPSGTVRHLMQISGAWSAFTGEAPAPAPARKKATPAESVKPTPAADSSDEPAEAQPAEVEAVTEAGTEAAPEAEPEEPS